VALGVLRSFQVRNVVLIPEKQTYDTFHDNNIRFTTITQFNRNFAPKKDREVFGKQIVMVKNAECY